MTFKVKDGISIAGSLFVDGNRNISAVIVTATTALHVTSSQQSTSTQTGAVIVTGGVGVGGNLYATALYDNGVRVLTTASLGASGVASISAGTDTRVSSSVGNVVVWNESTLQTITSRGATSNVALTLSNTTAASSTNSGALQIVGGVGIGGNLYVGGEIVAQKLTIQLTTVTTTQVTTDDIISTYNTTQSTSTNTGALQVAGGAGVGKDLYVGGAIYRNGIAIGYAYDGSAGYNGSAGFTGSRGYTGSAGYDGSKGFTGSAGYNGSVGFTGSAGYNGSAGFTGSAGYNGSVGYTGSAGYNGSVGYYGSVGYTGSKGIDGFSGSAGFWGSVGYTGSKGIDGFSGSAGYWGSVGYTGSKGFTGSAGYDGSKGFTGSAGYDGSKGFTGSAGYNGSVGYTGSMGYYGSVGYAGSMGYYGSVGYTGSMGYWGSVGYAGSAGYWGSVGYTGSLGYAGSAGPSNIINAITTASGTFYPVMVGATGNNQIAYADTGVYFDAAANALYVLGDFYVNGQQTIINSTSIQTGDKTISLSTSSASALLSINSGVQVGTYAAPYANLLFDGVSNWVVGGSAATGLKATNVTASGLTAGHVAYAGTGGLLSGSANHFWDNANSRLGIGTNAPATQLSNNATRIANADGLSTHLSSINWNVTGQGYVAAFGNLSAAAANVNAGLLVELASSDATDKILDLESGGVNRVRVLGNGNVGIGTSSPSGASGLALAINGGAAQTRIALKNTSTGDAAGDGFQIVLDSGGLDVGLEQREAASIRFTTSNTERVRIDSAGNVGIGTNAPVTLKLATTLQVYGNAKFGNANDRGLLSLGDIASASANVGIWRGGAGAYNAAGNYLNLGGYDGITFTTGAAAIESQTERVRIDASGNVGIGSTSPGAKLEVSMTRTASTNGIVLYLTDNVTGAQTDGVYKSIRSGSNGGSSVSEIRFLETDGTNNNTSIAFATQGVAGGLTERMRVTQSGALAFAGAANYGTSGQYLKSTGDGAPVWSNVSATSADTILLTNVTSGATPRYLTHVSTTTGYTSLSGSAITGLVYIPSTGHLGIGTQAPADTAFFGGKAVDVYGPVYARQNGNSAYYAAIGTSGGLSILSAAGTANEQLFYVAGAEKMRISNAGYLGVGISAPTNFLHVNDSSTNRFALRIQSTAANTLNAYSGIGFSGESGNTKGAILFRSLGTSYSRGNMIFALNNALDQTNASPSDAVMTLTPSGYVGIGVASPDVKLHIAGAADGDSVFKISGAGSTGATVKFADVDIGGQGYGGSYLAWGRGGSYDNWFMVFTRTNGNVSSERLRITSNGGIAFGGGANYGTSGYVLKSNGDAAPTWIDPSTLAVGALTVATVRQTVNASYFLTFVDSDNATATQESVYTTSSFVVNPSTGNVGLGSAAPAAKLHVVGSESRFGGVASGYISVYAAATRVGYIQANEGTDLRIAAEGAANPMTFYVNGSERARIDTAGNVGIGVSSPAAKLDLILATAATGRVDAIKSLHNGQNTLLISHFGQTHADSPAANQIAVLNAEQHLHLVTDTDANVKAGTSTLGIFLRSGGNVGIGTKSPGYKLQVAGSFAATTKSFVIEHPTRPGYDLRYGSLEGPENGVYVRGRLKGNKIELPEYWTKLVDPDSITVDLTPVGKYQKLYVADISNNTITVANDGFFNKAVDCFYTVWAERADVEKLVVEIQKP